jgi:hypothetical protein
MFFQLSFISLTLRKFHLAPLNWNKVYNQFKAIVVDKI